MITNKEIREYLGHNGRECKVVIRRNGSVERYGSPNETDRSKDFWTYIGEIGDIRRRIEKGEGFTI